jgi:tetratricopeptide (TPR) repeat protein
VRHPIVLALLLAAAACQGRAEQLAERADALLYARDYERAAKQLEVVLHECGDATDEDSLALKRRTLLKLADVRQHYLDDPRGALRAFLRAAEVSAGRPEAFEARLGAARLLKRRFEDPGRAADELEKALAIAPEHPDRHAHRLEVARLSMRAGRAEKALEAARRVMDEAEAGVKIDAALLTGSLLLIRNEPAEALAVYEHVLALDPPSEVAAQAQFEIARCHERLGALEPAIDAYAKAAKRGADAALVVERVDRLLAKIDAAKKAEAGRGVRRAPRAAEPTSDEPVARPPAPPASPAPKSPTRVEPSPAPRTRTSSASR